MHKHIIRQLAIETYPGTRIKVTQFHKALDSKVKTVGKGRTSWVIYTSAGSNLEPLYQ